MTQLNLTPTSLYTLLTKTQTVMYESPETLGQKYYIRFTVDKDGSILSSGGSRVFNWDINENAKLVLDGNEEIDVQVFEGPFVYTVANSTRRYQSQYRFQFPGNTSFGLTPRTYYSQTSVPRT